MHDASTTPHKHGYTASQMQTLRSHPAVASAAPSFETPVRVTTAASPYHTTPHHTNTIHHTTPPHHITQTPYTTPHPITSHNHQTPHHTPHHKPHHTTHYGQTDGGHALLVRLGQHGRLLGGDGVPHLACRVTLVPNDEQSTAMRCEQRNRVLRATMAPFSPCRERDACGRVLGGLIFVDGRGNAHVKQLAAAILTCGSCQ